MDTKEMANALTGTKASGGGSGEDWEAKYKTLKAEYDSKRPMLGRIEELSAKDKRISELEKELAQAKADKGVTTVTSQLTPEERGDIPDEYVGVAARIARKTSDMAIQGVNEELTQLRQERERERAEAQNARSSEFIGRIDRRFPGFLNAIREGGDKFVAWNKFLINNQGSVNAALASFNYDSLVYHIERFYREVLEVRPPNGEASVATTPDPTSHGGEMPAGGSGSAKVYTSEEYDALDEKCMKLRRQGRIEEYRKLRDELETALSEGRVRD